MKNRLDFHISYRAEISLNFSQNKREQIFNNLNFEKLNKFFRIYWNYPTSDLTVYKYTDREYTPKQSIKYYMDAILFVIKEML